MDCDVITDLMSVYESGAASEMTRRLVKEHLATCSTCRAAFETGSPDRDIGALPTPAQPEERAVLIRVQKGFFALFAFIPLFLTNATLVLISYFILDAAYRPNNPREARLGFPLSIVPTLLEMLILLSILLILRWLRRRYPPDRASSFTSACYLVGSWLALFGLAAISFLTVGSVTPVLALWLAVALALDSMRWTPRLAMGFIGLLMLVNMGVVVGFWFRFLNAV